MMKNELIEYPPTSHQHSWKPAILIQNDNTIYAIGNYGSNPFSIDFGVIECYDIRDKRWFVIDELNKILNITNEECKKRYFQCVLNSI